MQQKELKLLAESATGENRQIDFKESFDPSSSSEWANIIKDIIAFANSGGGVIVFGVKDDGSPAVFDKGIILGIDPATVADKISAHTREDFANFEIGTIVRRRKEFAVLFIGPSPSPLVFTRAGADVVGGGKQKPAFAKGSVYFRHGAKSDPGTTNDIRVTIDREVARLRRGWLEGIKKIAQIEPGEEVVVSRSLAMARVEIPGRIVADEQAQAFRPDDAAKIWPYRAKDLIVEISRELGKKISIPDIIHVKQQYKIDEKNRPDFVYRPYVDVSPRYSREFVGWLVSTALKNTKFFQEARELYKEVRKRK